MTMAFMGRSLTGRGVAEGVPILAVDVEIRVTKGRLALFHLLREVYTEPATVLFPTRFEINGRSRSAVSSLYS